MRKLGEERKIYYCCIDCGREVSDYRIKRCRKCADKQHSERMKGENNPAFKHGGLRCVDCGEIITGHKAVRCKECFHNYIKKSGILKNREKSKTWRDKISKTMLKKGTTVGKKNGMYGKITHGKWGKYNGIYMRSSYEIKFAFFLDCSGIEWEYEPRAFDLGEMTYTPDFYLLEFDCYIEIKGYWRDDAKEKYNKFKRQYPEIKIKLLNEKTLLVMDILN